MKTTRGFTLIELMVTVAVIGVSLALGVPSFRNMLQNSKLATQSNQVIALTNYARSEAVKRGTRISVCPRNAAGDGCTTAWGNGMLAFVDTDADGTLDTGEAVLRVTDALTGDNTLSAVLNGTTTAVSVIGYTGSGSSASSTMVVFTLCSPSIRQSRILSLSSVGRFSLTKGTCS